jgi:ABC-type nitrate/sulfonate/bicarbonate transport system substrate-binding protein
MMLSGRRNVATAVLKCICTVLFVSVVFVAQARTQEKIVVAYSGVSGFQGPLWAFNELQLFSKYQLSPEIVLIGGGTQSMQALLSGYTHFALASATAPMSIKLQGGDVVIVGAGLNKFPFTLVAQKEIDHPSKLAGKRIGIVNFGGSNELAVSLALAEWGIPRQSVTLLRSGSTAARLVALANKGIDATFLSMPFTLEAKKMGFKILAHMADMQAAFPMTVVVVNRAYLDKKRPVVKRFLAGYSEAIHALMNSKDLGVKIYRKYLKQEDKKILEETYDDIAGKFSFPPRVNGDGIRNTLDLVFSGPASAKANININQFMDESVLDELETEGFFKSLRK